MSVKRRKKSFVVIHFRDLSRTIYSSDTEFEIDSYLLNILNNGAAGPALKKKWQNRRNELLHLGRRSIEVAREMAETVNRDIALDIEDWRQTSVRADAAQDALKRLLDHLGRPSGTTTPAERAALSNIPLSRRVEVPLSQMLWAENLLTSEPKSSNPNHAARANAAILCEALTILQEMHRASKAFHKRILENRQNPGTPQKNAFVKEMMLAWIFISGRKPSAGNAAFIRFLDAGWQDICGIPPGDWENAIKKANVLKGEVLYISQNGPPWL